MIEVLVYKKVIQEEDMEPPSEEVSFFFHFFSSICNPLGHDKLRKYLSICQGIKKLQSNPMTPLYIMMQQDKNFLRFFLFFAYLLCLPRVPREILRWVASTHYQFSEKPGA